MQGEAEETEIVQPEEKKSSSSSTPPSKGDYREDGPLSRYVQGIKKKQQLHIGARDTPEGICCAVGAPEKLPREVLEPPSLETFKI